MNNRSKKRIIFVDTWVRGLKFINPVAKFFSNHKIFFLHYSSLYGDGVESSLKNQLCDEFNGEIIDLKDIGSIDEFLKQQRPDFLIFISVHGVLQRVVNHFSQSNGIKNLFFPHGARFEEALPLRTKYSLKKYFSRVAFYLRVFIIFGKQIQTKHIFKYLLFACEFILFKNQFNLKPQIEFGKRFDFLFLNHKEDISYFNNFFGEKIESKIIGNVSVIEDCLKAQDLPKISNSLIFYSQPDMKNEIHETSLVSDICDLVRKYNLELLIRPHPGENIENCLTLYKNIFPINFKLDKTPNMAYSLSNASIIVGFNSASLLAANYLCIPALVYSSSYFVSSPYFNGKFYFQSKSDIELFLDNRTNLVKNNLVHPGEMILAYIEK